MQALGVLNKMLTSFINPVQYFLRLGDDKVPMNSLIGNKIKLQWTGNIYCTVCNKRTSKSFGEGMCYPCFANGTENAECILRPELCEAHLGKGRDAEWENRNHFKPHFVYLALTNSVKVGVTRGDQLPTRWIDQGAHKGIVLAETPYRQLAGFIEVVLKDHVSDKTNWQRMLKNESSNGLSLLEEKIRIHQLIPEHFQQYKYASDEVVEITYPVLEYPQKVTSISFEKMACIDMKLIGIRGQYFIFENGFVINIRSKSGYEVELSA
jgi:hypothetical protein